MAGRDIIGMYNELHTSEAEKQAALEAEKAAKVGKLLHLKCPIA